MFYTVSYLIWQIVRQLPWPSENLWITWENSKCEESTSFDGLSLPCTYISSLVLEYFKHVHRGSIKDEKSMSPVFTFFAFDLLPGICHCRTVVTEVANAIAICVQLVLFISMITALIMVITIIMRKKLYISTSPLSYFKW